MDINDARSLITVVSFVAFVAIVVWVYAGKRKAGFEEVARSVLDESDHAAAEQDQGERK